jgi:ABC-type branched-subunit amino acid transport system substrate-binding protein
VKNRGGTEQGNGFDAIFLPGEARQVGLIIPQLAFYEGKDVVLLGTMGWNNAEFLKMVGSYAEGAIFVDGFFLGSSDPFIQDFIGQYREQFHHDPDIFAAQAYDAAQLILEAIKQGASTRSEVKEAIAAAADVPSASGYLYNIQDGEAIKKPFFMQVKKGKWVQIN